LERETYENFLCKQAESAERLIIRAVELYIEKSLSLFLISLSASLEKLVSTGYENFL
jgi:hypothetical protein